MPLNYIGSKKSLLDFLQHVYTQQAPPCSSFGDLFAGTGVVGQHFNTLGLNITANDTEYYSFIINQAKLLCPYNNTIKTIIEKLNNLTPKEGLLYQYYSPKANRLFFTEHNAKKIDAIREAIEHYRKEPYYYFLLASLIEAADKVANVSCVYGSFLKKFKPSAMKELVLVPIHTNVTIEGKNKVYQKDVNEIDDTIDIIYLDPPYNSRQYSANYFVLNYIAHYDKTIRLKGKTGIFCDYYKSRYSSTRKAKDAFTELLGSLKTQYIMLSYNNEGIMSSEEIKEILMRYGEVTLYKKQYKKFKAQKNVKKDYVQEYCYFLDKTKKTRYSEKEATNH